MGKSLLHLQSPSPCNFSSILIKLAIDMPSPIPHLLHHPLPSIFTISPTPTTTLILSITRLPLLRLAFSTQQLPPTLRPFSSIIHIIIIRISVTRLQRTIRQPRTFTTNPTRLHPQQVITGVTFLHPISITLRISTQAQRPTQVRIPARVSRANRWW